jgi:hypothetical protein
MYNFSILRDLKKMLLLINCCNKRGNHAISQNWRYFRSRIVFFYTLLNQCNTTDKHNHTHKKKRYLAVISRSIRFKEFNRKKTATKTSNKFKIVPRIETCDAGFSSSKFCSSCLPFVVKQTTLPVFS